MSKPTVATPSWPELNGQALIRNGETMELRHLRYFLMAAEEANISRAAARLNVSQPAVSRQIRDLEKELGVALFERQRNGLSLTEAGQTALGYARETLRSSLALSDAMQRISGEHKARIIRIGYLPTALSGFLADGLRRFRDSRENVVVQLHEMTPTAQAKALCEGHIDIALLGRASLSQRREYEVVAIRKTPVAIALPDDHTLAKRKSIDLAELGGEPFVTLDDSLFPGHQRLLNEMWEKAGKQPSSSIVAAGLSEILGLVGGGTGAALVPADMAELPHPRVTFVPLRHPRRTLIFSAAMRKDDKLAKELANLLADPSSDGIVNSAPP